MALITSVEAQELIIKNRWRGTVITANEGAVSVRPMTNAANARWELVRVGPHVRIRSVASGQHLHIERGPLQLGPINPGWWSAMWNIESVGNSFVRIRNRWKSNLYLNIETGRLQASRIQPGWWSAMWQLQEPRGTAQPPARPTGVGQTTTRPQTPVGNPSASEDVATVLRLINQHRARGFRCPGAAASPPTHALRLHTGLSEAARNWAVIMRDTGIFQHNTETSTMGARITAVCGTVAAAENIAGNGTAEGAVSSWMKSPGHCRNIMSPTYRVIGIGLARGARFGANWVQKFASDCR